MNYHTHKKESQMHSKKEYEVKIQKLERENRKILDREESNKQKTKELQQENKYLRKRIKEVRCVNK